MHHSHIVGRTPTALLFGVFERFIYIERVYTLGV